MLSIDYLGIGGTKVASLDLRNKTTEYMRQLDVQVNYGPRVKGENIDLPVVGGGGDICVVLGDQGEIIAFSGPRPGLEAQLKGSYPVVPLEQANTSYDDMVGNPQSLSYTVDLAYYLPPNMANQSYLIPVYEYRGTAIIDNETIPLLITLIPATKFPQEVYSEIGNRSMALDPDKDSRLNARITTAAANQSAISALSFSNPNSIYEYGTYLNGVPDHGPGNTQGFVDEMAAIGWTKLYQWGGSDAWESDWNRNENILDQYNTGIDNADITFYHGHGNPNGWGLSPPDDSFLDKSEVQRRYGDIDMEWVFIASCGPLESNDIIPCSSNPISAFNWGYVFNGLHGIMGRASVAYANTEEGRSVAKYMKQGNTVIDSWFRAAREVQPSTNGWSCPYGPQVYAAALVPYRGTISAENDHLWGCGSVSADIPNPDKFWLIWTQC